MHRELIVKLVISAAIAGAIGAVMSRSSERALSGANDFIPLYVGAQSVGSDDLYAPEAYIEFQNERFGAAGESLRFTRPPFYAVLLAPLGLLDYQWSYWAWCALRLAGVAVFILFFPGAKSKADTLLWVALSIPIYAGLMAGQDSLLLLPLLALALRWERSRPLAAGLALSLCAIKFHLFLMIPLLFLAQRRWDVAKGFAGGAALLTVLSFAGGGLSWPAEYYRTLTDNRVSPEAELMPNLHGLGLPAAAEAALCLLAAVAAWFIMRRVRFELGLAAALLGGLLISYHAYVMDTVILIPALMTILLRADVDWLRLPAVLFLSPVPPLLLLSGPPKSYLMQAGLGLLLAALTYWAVREPAKAFVAADSAVPSS